MVKLVDTHMDTASALYNKNKELYSNDIHVSIEKLKNIETPILFNAIYLDETLVKTPYESTINVINYFTKEVEKNKDYIQFCRSWADVKENMAQGRISSVLTIEGGEALEGKIENVKVFRDMGIRAITLTWNRENELGYGAVHPNKSGLKDFGIEVVKEMNKQNMFIDVSHLNENGFWDVIKYTEKPIIASHSNCFAICDHLRNLKDDQIKAIKETGGMISLTFHSGFLAKDKTAGLEDIVKHISHYINLIGDKNLGIGSDFDGTSFLPSNIKDISYMPALYNDLLAYFPEETLNNIFYKNYHRFFEANLA